MKQIYEVWTPFNGSSQCFFIDEITDKSGICQISICNELTREIVLIRFVNRILFLVRDESEYSAEFDRSIGLGNGCFYEIKKSWLIEMYRKDTILLLDDIKHFAIVTDEDCIDILVVGTPQIECKGIKGSDN